MSNRQVPSVPAQLDPSLRNFLSAVREVINTGSLNQASSQVVVTQTGGGSGGVTVDYLSSLDPNLAALLNSIIPTTPTDLAITGLFNTVFLYWTAAAYSYHSHVEIWRIPGSAIDGTPLNAADVSLINAVLIGTSVGNIYIDTVNPGARFFYWIRFVSAAGNKGPYNASLGTLGATSQDMNTVLVENDWKIAVEQLIAVSAWIGEADILDGAITNLKIGNVIQSSNYNGTQGWYLDKASGVLNVDKLTVRNPVTGQIIFQSSTGGIEASSVLNQPSDNLIKNPDLTGAAYLGHTCKGWADFYTTGINDAYYHQEADPAWGWGPTWDHSQNVYYARVISGTGHYAGISTDVNIPIDPSQHYTFSFWRYTFNTLTRSDLVVSYYDLNNAFISGGVVLTQSSADAAWTRYFGVIGAGFYAIPTNARFVNLHVFVVNASDGIHSSGQAMATRIAFNRGKIPSAVVTPYNPRAVSDVYPITVDNVDTYIGAAAIKRAHIGIAEIDTLRLQGNAVTVKLYAELGDYYVYVTSVYNNVWQNVFVYNIPYQDQGYGYPLTFNWGSFTNTATGGYVSGNDYPVARYRIIDNVGNVYFSREAAFGHALFNGAAAARTPVLSPGLPKLVQPAANATQILLQAAIHIIPYTGNGSGTIFGSYTAVFGGSFVEMESAKR